MSDSQNPKNKGTPAKKTQSRQKKPSKQRGYASENDAGGAALGRRVPRTPDKSGAASPAPAASQTSGQSKNKQQSKSKAKPSRVHQASPGDHHHQSTTPQRAMPIKGGLPAFAGATFHASPAPSALPLPSFLAKPPSDSPVSNVNLGSSLPKSLEAGGYNSIPSGLSSGNAGESPLDFMFRAHKQEQERRAGSSPAHTTYNGNLAHVSRSDGVGRPSPSSRSILQDELDGTPSLDIGPAFSTPYQTRINSARSSRHPLEQSQNSPSAMGLQSSDDASEALKKYLFGGAPRSTDTRGQAPPPGQYYGQVPVSYNQPRQHDEPRPMVQANNIQAMEDNLKRILKLDLGSQAPAPRGS